jgi:putative membrane protein
MQRDPVPGNRSGRDGSRLVYARSGMVLPAKRDKEGRGMHFKLVLSLVLAGLALIFILQNVAVVEIRFLFWTISMSRALFMLFMLAIGFIVGWIAHSLMMHRGTRTEIR